MFHPTTDAAPASTPAAELPARPAVSRNTAGRSRPSRGTSRRWLMRAAAVALLVGGGGIWGWRSYTHTAPDQVVTAAVVRGDVEDSITALGNLQPRDYVDVGTQVS